MKAGGRWDEGSSSQQHSVNCFSLRFSFLFSALVMVVQFGISALSYTKVPQGGSDSLSGIELDGPCCHYNYGNAE